jgi:hypothetical protein
VLSCFTPPGKPHKIVRKSNKYIVAVGGLAMKVILETRRNLWIMAEMVFIAETFALSVSYITNDIDFKKTLQ